MWAIVATVIAASAAGILAERRYGSRAGLAARRSLMFVLYFVLPPAIFFNLARADIDLNAGAGVGFAYVAVALTVGTAWLVASRVLGLGRPAIGAVMCCAVVANTAYMGYPMVAVLLGFDNLSQAVVYDVLVAYPSLLLVAFSIGAAFGTAGGEGPAARMRAFFTRNPLLYAAVLGLMAPDALAPDALVDAARIAIVAILPLGFFAVGAALAEEAEEGALPVPPPFDRAIATAVGARLLLAPALLYALSTPFIDLPTTYLLLAAMPCGINTMIVTHAYGLDLRIAASAVAWSTAIAIAAAIPLSILT